MEKIPWYESAIVRQQVIMIVVGLAGVLKLATDIDIDATVTAVFAGIAAVMPVWTMITRLTKAHPPLTDAAALREDAVQKELTAKAAGRQGGFVRAGMLGVLLALGSITVLSVTTAGCETIGVPAAKTFNERLAVGYVSVTAVRDSATTYFSAELAAAAALPDEQRAAREQAIRKDAENVQAQADNAREALDIARTLKDLDVRSAETRLTAAIQILEALQTYLGGR